MKNIIFTKISIPLLLLFVLTACTEEPLGNDPVGGGHTLILPLSVTISSLPETKAVVRPARPGSEAAASGFSYELVSTDTDTTSIPVTTKAPATLKNVYALLFTSDGTFNGRANIGTVTAGTATDIPFTNVIKTDANCRLVIVANNNGATSSYASSAGTANFDSFSGNYAAFQKLIITSGVTKDEDIPYAGSVTAVDLSLNGAIAVPLYHTLAKITLSNTFNITGGPVRSGIALYNAGERRFAPLEGNSYEGAGTTVTTSFVEPIAAGNADSYTWYIGENIRPAGTGINSAADRNSKNAPPNACYIRIASATQSAVNANPGIGEELNVGGTRQFTYDIYLGTGTAKTDFTLRRHTNYTITSTVNGTLASQQELASVDGRVAYAQTGASGLVVGVFGGPVSYSTGTAGSQLITGSYSKLLLVQPNTSGTSDEVRRPWGDQVGPYQTNARKYWDKTYIYGINTGGTVGGMRLTNSVYEYCQGLTAGGVAAGTWYVPTQAQLMAIYAVFPGLTDKREYIDYSAFHTLNYWSSTEDTKDNARFLFFGNGVVGNGGRGQNDKVRCVRDFNTSSARMVTTANGYPVIDLTGLSPFNIINYADANIRREEINTQSPSNTAFLKIGASASKDNGHWNSKLSSKFQVMRSDLPRKDWSGAYNACKTYSGEGGAAGQWRLPTQRELMMVYVLHPQLKGVGSFSVFNGSFYWTCTEDNATYSWYVSFYHGETTSQIKGNIYYVRCVRDL